MGRGRRQSPISLTYRRSIVEKDANRLKFINYDTPLWDWYIINCGTALKLAPNHFVQGPGAPKVMGKDFPGKFVAQYVIYHWGSNGAMGSEHIIEEEQYSLEIQIVHTNEKYASMEEARKHRDGIAIISMLGREDPHRRPCAYFCPFSDRLSLLTKFNTASYMPKDFCLIDLVETFFKGSYFAYEGSLTTPPYSESVKWIVFGDPVRIPTSFFVQLRRLRDVNGDLISDNCRRLQPQGNRLVILCISCLAP